MKYREDIEYLHKYKIIIRRFMKYLFWFLFCMKIVAYVYRSINCVLCNTRQIKLIRIFLVFRKQALYSKRAFGVPRSKESCLESEFTNESARRMREWAIARRYTLSNGRRVPVWPAWDTAHGRSRCAGRNSLSLSSLCLLLLFFLVSIRCSQQRNRCSIFLLDECFRNFDLRRRRVNAPYVKSVKIRALANRNGIINFFLWLLNFHRSPSGPESRHREVDHSTIGRLTIYSGSTADRRSRWSDREISPTCEGFLMSFSLRAKKTLFHQKVGQCSTSAIGIAAEGREGIGRTTPKLLGWTFPGVPAVPKRGWLDKEFAEYEIAAIVSAAITRGAILSTSDPFTILVIRSAESPRGALAFRAR